MSQRKDLIREILDHGKRSWDAQTDAGGKTDVFLMEIVMPLRKLERDGLFPELDEQASNHDGIRKIDKVSIEGAVNLDFKF
jgi:hypothetical protein